MTAPLRENGAPRLFTDGWDERPLVLLFMRPGRNRSLLADALADAYRVEVTADPGRLQSAFDCCIIDRRTLEQGEDALRRRVEVEETFLPVVLLVEENRGSVGHSKYWNTVDDIIDLPADRDVLLARIENLVARRQTTVELARQNERLENFADVVSHDLRNPLGVAEGRLELAMMEFASEDLDALASALERMRGLIEDLLSLAREGDAVTDTESISLREFADGCWRHVDTKNATLVVDAHISIEGSPRRLRQLFENLFRNAIEHGGDAVTIRVGSLDDGFFIEDDGPGIPHDHRGGVFESGVSLDDSGTGLGLAIVKQVADAHGWTVEVGDSESGGARFAFTGGRSG